MHQHGGDIYRNQVKYDFSANINPLGTPKEIIEAAYEGIKLSAHYPDPYCEQLLDGIAQAEGVKKEQLIVGNGAAELIFAICNSYKPKKALLLAPTFAEYEQALRFAGSEVEYYELTAEDEFRVGEDFLLSMKEEHDILFLCNPNNPTGETVNSELLVRILVEAKKKNIMVILDECFQEFLGESHKGSMKPLLEKLDNLFILKAFTKLYAMAGLRLGYGMTGNMALLERLHQGLQPWNVSIPAQMAGVKALQLEEYVKKTEQLIVKERDYLITNMKELGYQIYGSKANYIFFVGDEDLKEYCLKHDILIRDCSNYIGLEKGYYRIAVRSHIENKALIGCLRNKVKGDVICLK